MSRYIDVSNLDIPSDENDYDELVAFADKIAEMITDVPSIDIVRCKECKWFNDSEHCPCDVETPTGRYITDLGNDGYCSYGEREGE